MTYIDIQDRIDPVAAVLRYLAEVQDEPGLSEILLAQAIALEALSEEMKEADDV